MWRARAEELISIENEFGNRVRDLHRHYVVPDLQDVNPPDDRDDPGLIAPRQSAFGLFDEFLRREFGTENGNGCMFVLGDAGMGKTSLLVMLKYRHLTSSLPTSDDCVLVKLGPDTAGRLDAVRHPAGTILLLDSLDEDREAHDHPDGVEGRIRDLMPRIIRFRRVVISCRTPFFVETSRSLATKAGHFVLDSYECGLKYISLFSDAQVETYLQKRFRTGLWQTLFRAVARRGVHRLAHMRRAAGAMHGLRMRPLLLSCIDEFVDEGSAGSLDLSNRYAVYHRLVGNWLRRDAPKLHALADGDGWAVAMSLAIHLARSSRHQVSRNELLALPDLKAIDQFQAGSRSLICRTGDFQYHFSHLTIQEFLLAHAVIEGGRDLTGIVLSSASVGFLADGKRWRQVATVDLRGASLASEVDPASLVSLLWNIRIDMVHLPAGEFVMGAPETEEGSSDNERPRHRVRLTRPFWLGKYQVTQAQYKAVMGKDCSFSQERECPLAGVSWYGAVLFCQRLNEAMGEFGRLRFRLPTEAEWEYACRAGTDTAFNDGSPCTGFEGKDPALDRLGWYDGNSGNDPSPAGKMQANAWGLHDMHGNFCEWCADWYKPYPAEAQTDPAGPADGEKRVLRGGGYWNFAGRCRSASRDMDVPGSRIGGLGFRLAAGQPPDSGTDAGGAPVAPPPGPGPREAKGLGPS
jgi:formylglycine-generating enzyme required for sulfatase activity